LSEAAPLCFGMSEWFDSTDPEVHQSCKALCARCPAIDQCRATRDELVERDMLIEGTWAGELHGAKVATNRRTCGTPWGPYHHRKHGEQVCDECADARRAYDRARRQRETVA